VTRARLAFWSVLANEQARPVTTTAPNEPVVVRVPADQLEAAIDALVGNVFAHTPPGTPFSVSVIPGPPAQLIVQDQGPGLAEQALLDRGRSATGSTGLGLDIARQTGQSAGGGLTVSPGPAGRGLTATVTFGPPSSGPRPPT